MSIREVIEWIEVTERLPEDDGLAMVALSESECGDWDVPTWIGYYDDSEDQWYSADGAEIDVVRWARMPTGEATTDPLIATAPKLLELARKYASECADCDGEGVIHVQIDGDDAERPCPDCKDIREVIAAAEGAS